jgi:hypothetical protein
VNSPWSQESYLSDFTKPGCWSFKRQTFKRPGSSG